MIHSSRLVLAILVLVIAACLAWVLWDSADSGTAPPTTENQQADPSPLSVIGMSDTVSNETEARQAVTATDRETEPPRPIPPDTLTVTIRVLDKATGTHAPYVDVSVMERPFDWSSMSAENKRLVNNSATTTSPCMPTSAIANRPMPRAT